MQRLDRFIRRSALQTKWSFRLDLHTVCSISSMYMPFSGLGTRVLHHCCFRFENRSNWTVTTCLCNPCFGNPHSFLGCCRCRRRIITCRFTYIFSVELLCINSSWRVLTQKVTFLGEANIKPLKQPGFQSSFISPHEFTNEVNPSLSVWDFEDRCENGYPEFRARAA